MKSVQSKNTASHKCSLNAILCQHNWSKPAIVVRLVAHRGVLALLFATSLLFVTSTLLALLAAFFATLLALLYLGLGHACLSFLLQDVVPTGARSSRCMAHSDPVGA